MRKKALGYFSTALFLSIVPAVFLAADGGDGHDHHGHKHSQNEHQHQHHGHEHDHSQHEHQHHNPDAHVHGRLELNLAQQDADVWVQLRAPAADITGFETAPVTEAEEDAVKQAEAKLADADAWLSFDNGECRLASAEVAAGFDAAAATGHAEFTAEYVWHCARAPVKMNLSIGRVFHGIDTVEVSWLTDAGQGARSISHGRGSLDLR